ncbi:MAG: GGDEF domain-containing protein [Pseudomonadales bacterium]|nr:GGDEF domain-containing protein [Pseudomonadales bacterium]
MKEHLLDAITNMTASQDIDSLECSLVLTLFELIDCQRISLYKLLESDDFQQLEQVASLQKDDEASSGTLWQQNSQLINSDSPLQQALMNRDVIKYPQADGQTILMPILCGDNIYGVMKIEQIKSLESVKHLITSFIKIYQNYLTILNESERDKLTGLFNRRTFDKKLNRLLLQQSQQRLEIANAPDERRELQAQSSAWLVMVDIDHFKRVNDEFGHICGDEVLLILSQLMRKRFRSGDLLFRFGGEEFVIILEPTNAHFAQKVLQDFLQIISQHRFPLINHMTISMGYTTITEEDYPETVLDLADKALYYAKENGRNRLDRFEDLVAAGLLIPPASGDAVELF